LFLFFHCERIDNKQLFVYFSKEASNHAKNLSFEMAWLVFGNYICKLLFSKLSIALKYKSFFEKAPKNIRKTSFWQFLK